MITLLLGHTGYIGSEFMREIQRRGDPVKTLPREMYSNFSQLYEYIHERSNYVSAVINAAGYIGKPNVDACELAKTSTLRGNLILPLSIAHACCAAGKRCVHVSSGCIYNGDGPYGEEDEPNFSFDKPPCSYYSGTKALCEDSLAGVWNCYVLRLRLPFDENDNERNYLSKLLRYPKLLQGRNSISHRSDFVKAALDLLEKRAPCGVYNMTNPGSITTDQVVDMLKRKLNISREFEYWNEEEFYKHVVAPRSNCTLNTDKLAAAGVRMRPVEDALEDAMDNWKWEPQPIGIT